MCQSNNNHIIGFKDAQIFENVSKNIYTIKGKAPDPKTGALVEVYLHFRKNSTPCQGTQGGGYVAYFENSEWAKAKEKAQKNVEFFHLHGDLAGSNINKAALSYANAGGPP